MDSNINKLKNILKGNTLGKFIKANLDLDEYSLEDIESLAFKISLSGCKIINSEYNQLKLNEYKKGIKKATKYLKEFNFETSTPLISINFKLDKNINKLVNKIKFLYESELNFDILNIIFGDKSDQFIEEFLNELSKIDNALIYTINFNRNKLSNSSIIKIINTFYKRISKNLIIEIDYIARMSNEEDLNSDLQILSTADIIYKDLCRENKRYRKIPIILPIKRFSFITKFASQCSVKYDGINLKDFIFSDSDIEKIDKKRISLFLMEKISNEAKDNIKQFLESNLSYLDVTDK